MTGQTAWSPQLNVAEMWPFGLRFTLSLFNIWCLCEGFFGEEFLSHPEFVPHNWQIKGKQKSLSRRGLRLAARISTLIFFFFFRRRMAKFSKNFRFVSGEVKNCNLNDGVIKSRGSLHKFDWRKTRVNLKTQVSMIFTIDFTIGKKVLCNRPLMGPGWLPALFQICQKS